MKVFILWKKNWKQHCKTNLSSSNELKEAVSSNKNSYEQVMKSECINMMCNN